MVRSKNGGNASGIPSGQTASGPGAATLPNPKLQAGSAPQSLGPVAGAGGAALAGSGMAQTSSYFDGENTPNIANKGSGATEPDPSIINRGYSEVNGSNVPAVTFNASANRLMDIDPGSEVLTPPGDTTQRPGKPSYGTGGPGD